jgi:DNA-binding transcriptional MerR regulator
MFKIGEFSKLMQVSIRMLRYYDETGLLRPAAVDKYTGYRLYSVEQIPVLQKIILLRDVKFTVAEIATALANWDDNFIVQQLVRKKQTIEAEMRLERQRIGKIEMAINDINQGIIATHHNVSFKSVPSFTILSLRKVIPSYNYEGVLWGELFRFIKQERLAMLIPQGDNNLAIYHDQEHKDSNVDVEVGVIVNSLGKDKDGFTFRETEPVEMMASMMVYGPYDNIGNAYKSFAYWLEQHQQYQMTGLCRQICHKGPYNETNPDRYLTEIQTPVINRSPGLV